MHIFKIISSTVLASTNSHSTEVERLLKLELVLKECKFLVEDVPAHGRCVGPDFFNVISNLNNPMIL